MRRSAVESIATKIKVRKVCHHLDSLLVVAQHKVQEATYATHTPNPERKALHM